MTAAEQSDCALSGSGLQQECPGEGGRSSNTSEDLALGVFSVASAASPQPQIQVGET